MYVLPQNAWQNGATPASRQSTTLGSSYAVPNSFSGGFSTSLVVSGTTVSPQVMQYNGVSQYGTPLMAQGSYSLNSSPYVSTMQPVTLPTLQSNAGLYSSTSMQLASTSTSRPMQLASTTAVTGSYALNDYDPVTSQAATSPTSLDSPSKAELVGSQSAQFVQESNRLRDMGVAKVEMLDPTEQDSDLMERMANGIYTGSKATGDIPLISLGCSCGPKLSFKDIGRGAETLPFDWSRTTVDALLQFISTGFAGFFDLAIHKIVYTDDGGKEWTAFRSPIHSFWHDDPTVPAMRERYTRRINRFMSIDARSQPVLFVRSVASTDEIPRLLEVQQLLVSKFGPHAKLLAIVDFQGPPGPAAYGPCVLQGNDGLLLYPLDTMNVASQAAPYGEAVLTALKWVIGQPIRTVKFASIQQFQALLVPNDWGMYGAGKVPAFVQ
mmetsp:Transcript_104462/g.164957  ORF Transcript_104462/g.164957 Transcript_104462/m.164957 type:complete len:437 (+) Transcript_104462:90-1400(+)